MPSRPWTRKATTLLAAAALVAGVTRANAGEMGKMAPGVSLGGYVAASYHYNFNKGAVNRLRIFDTNADNFSHDAAMIALTSHMTKDAKFEVNLYHGPVAQVFSARGTSSTDDTDITQAYASYKFHVGKGLEAKFGKFVTLLGSEVIDTRGVRHTSRSFMFGYSIPFTHTGLLLTYPFHEKFAASAGVVNGWDVVLDNNREKTLLYQLAFPVHKRAQFYLNGTFGTEGAPGFPTVRRAGQQTNIVDFIATLNPSDRLEVMANADVGSLEDGALSDAGELEAAKWWGFALYGRLQAHDPYLGLGARFEIFNDADGVRIGAVGPAGLAENYIGVTVTADTKLEDHLIGRLGLRLDSVDEDVFLDSDGLASGTQGTAGVELIYTY